MQNAIYILFLKETYFLLPLMICGHIGERQKVLVSNLEQNRVQIDLETDIRLKAPNYISCSPYLEFPCLYIIRPTE